jgi:hypothetical protein
VSIPQRSLACVNEQPQCSAVLLGHSGDRSSLIE